MADSPADGIQSVDWLMGAALMIRSETWQEVGPFDERFFLYFDEVDWCHRCSDVGWEIRYFPMAQIVHYEGRSSQQVPSTSQVLYNRSKVRYYRKYYGAIWATVVRVFILAKYASVLTEETAKWAVGRRREYRSCLMRACWQALKSGLR